MATHKIIALAREYRKYLADDFFDLTLKIDAFLSTQNVTDNEIIQLFQSFESLVRKQRHANFFSSHDAVMDIKSLADICAEFITKAQALQEMEQALKNNTLKVEGENNENSFMLKLSDEILLNVLSYLTPKELQEISLVSKRLHRLSQDNSVKSTIVIPDYGQLIDSEEYKFQSPSVQTDAFTVLPNKLFANALEDKTICIWDLKANKCVQKLKGHKNAVHLLAALPHEQLASCSREGSIKIWDLKTGNCMQDLQGPKETVLALAASANGLLACALKSYNANKMIQIWDLKTSTCIQELSSAAGPIRALTFLPHNQLAGATDQGIIKIWDLKTSTCVQELALRDNRYAPVYTKIKSLVLLPHDLLASGSDDGVIRIWNLNSGKCIQKLTQLAAVSALVPLPNKHLASSGEGVISIWDLTAAKYVQKLSIKGTITSLAVSPDGTLMCGTRNKLTMWSFAPLILDRKPGTSPTPKRSP